MSNDKLPTVKVTTPKGRASWPRLDAPDTKYKAEGQYSIKIVLGEAAARPLIDAIEKVGNETYEMVKDKIAEAKAKEKNPKKRAEIAERADPAYKELYGDDDKPTGEYEFNFKMTASGVSKKTGKPWTRKPAVFDAKGTPIVDVAAAKIGGGSTVRVSGNVSGFYTAALGAGTSLQLEGVQVIECRSYGDRSASAHGFGEEEGYEAEAPNANGFQDETQGEGSDAKNASDF